jgi:isopenicillin N synthase-like dioxygenase
MHLHPLSYQNIQASAQVAGVLRTIGFAVLTDTPIAPELITEVYTEWQAFFGSEQKQHYRFDPAVQSGYFPLQSETAQGEVHADLKEFFHLYEWTKLPDGFSDRTWQLFTHLKSLANELLDWVAAELPSAIAETLSMPLPEMIAHSTQTLMRPIHYPPLAQLAATQGVRAAAHTDINLITLLPVATDAGLEVQDLAGQWWEVPHAPGSIIVNVGDMLQYATQGYYRSTLHRVVNPTGDARQRSRYSMPLFLHPHSEVKLSAEKTAGLFLRERLIEIGLYS